MPRHFSLKYVSIPAKKCLAQRKNPSLPVTSCVFRYTLKNQRGPSFFQKGPRLLLSGISLLSLCAFAYCSPAVFLMATPHNSASRFGERFFVKPRFEKRRNTLCTRKGHAASVRLLRRQRLRNISSFSNRRIGGKDPPKRADAIVRCCLIPPRGP